MACQGRGCGARRLQTDCGGRIGGPEAEIDDVDFILQAPIDSANDSVRFVASVRSKTFTAISSASGPLVEQGGDSGAVAEPIFVAGHCVTVRSDGDTSGDVADVRVRSVHASINHADAYRDGHAISGTGLRKI